MELSIYQVDAFASQVFRGNPAAICPLERWLPDETLQSIATENNLAETAYFVRTGDRYHLRWFTPACEVDLCGHATLASAYVLFEYLNAAGDTLRFDTKSGELAVTRDSGLLTMDFPARPPRPVTADLAILKALGGNPVETLAARDLMVVYSTEADVRSLKPDLFALMKIEYFAVIVTAPGDDVDFVSRFFAPAKGVPEDPVTGSAHTTLIPYWAGRLGKTELRARQVSPRSGELYCQLAGSRVKIAGHAAPYLKGTISIPENGHSAL
jgi:PhzF family phenazine biosynthesis protein